MTENRFKLMDNLSRADLPAREDAKRPGSQAAVSAMVVLRQLYAALDSVLFEVETASNQRHNFAQGINFYDEVRRFEISLIRQALKHARGSQVRAAASLGLNRTTLNAKIKH